MTLEVKTKKYLVLRAKIDKIKESKIRPLEEEFNDLKAELTQDLIQASEDFSKKNDAKLTLRFPFATLSLGSRVTPKVTDVKTVIEFLKKEGLEKEYISEQPNDIFYDSYLREAAKVKKQVPGVEYQETFYPSVR